MAIFNLLVKTFDLKTLREEYEEQPETKWFYVTSISFDKQVVANIKSLYYNRKDGRFLVSYDMYEDVYKLEVSPIVLDDDISEYSVPIFYEYEDVDGGLHNVIEENTVRSFENTDDQPMIKYIENIASKIGESVVVTIHGENFTEGLHIFLRSDSACYQIDPDEVLWDFEQNTATFVVAPGMLDVDDAGNESCGLYSITLGYGDCDVPGDFKNDPSTNNLSIIRYKFDDSNDAAGQNSTLVLSVENRCYTKSDMSLIYDNTDLSGNPVANAASGAFGDTIYVRIQPGQDCRKIKYYRVKVKYNKNLKSKYGEITLNGISLQQGDIVWLANQFNTEENGLWVVTKSAWVGLNTESDDPEEVCTFAQEPLPVDWTTFIDLGARVKYKVDYSCSDDVPVKYGPQTACSYNLVPGDVVALSNQISSPNGVWLVQCAEWAYLGPYDAINGTVIDVSNSIVIQNDIDFCKCGGIFHIDYYYLNPSCYLAHLRRTVKVMCAGASIAPNTDNQFIITEYVIRTGEEDSLVGDNGRTPGDPVKEDCIKRTEDFDSDNALAVIETRPDDYDFQIIRAPDCSKWCDMPRYYNLRMPNDYRTSSDSNGFTILFWQFGLGGWHLYAYVGAGNQLSGMKYYVYHLHTQGHAVEHMIDVNDGYWFTETETGVIADGFGLVDDTWEFPIVDDAGNIVDTTHILSDNYLYMSWSIKCTTTLLAHRTYEEEMDPIPMRKTCADMEDAGKFELAKEYMIGMEHVYGFSYYKSVMSKSQFCDIYNSYAPGCIYANVVEVLGTDEDEPFYESIDDEGNESYIRK